MLPDIGATEILVIAIVALIVVGPKDLPVLLRRLGQFMAKLRGMASEFRASFDEMARASELDELRKEVEAMRRGHGLDIGVPEITQTFDELNQSLSDAGVQLHPPMSYQYAQPEPAAIAAPAPAKAPRARKAPAKATATAAAAKSPAKRTASKAAAPKAAARKLRAKKSGEGAA